MILMLNCSYKGKAGNTQYYLELLKNEVKEHSGEECKLLKLRNIIKNEFDNFVSELKKADALIIGAPLYVDGLPAQAVKLLEMLLENHKGKFPQLPVYVVSNLGFYESIQIKNLFEIVENWCHRMGMIYGGGLAVGAGPMVSTLDKLPLKAGPNKEIGTGLQNLAEAILKGKSLDNCYANSKIPRQVYMRAAHMLWGKTAKANGLSVKDVK